MKKSENKKNAEVTNEECVFIEFYCKLSEEKRDFLQIINNKSSQKESE